MKRFLPTSLLGQVMAVLALGLLTAQVISTVLLYQASEQRREANIVNAIAFRLIADGMRTPGERAQERRERLDALRREGLARGGPRAGAGTPGAGGRLRLGLEFTPTSAVAPGERRLSRHEETLGEVLASQGLVPTQIMMTSRLAVDDPFVRELVAQRPSLRPPDWRTRRVIVASIEMGVGEGWVTARLPDPPRPSGGLVTIVMQTLVIFAVLVLLLYLVLRRIIRPLAQLTDRVSDFSRRPDQAVRLIESGPSDTRRLIAAHNAMEARIAALLDEKDVMLGAIGHDLKTPLAALRVRIESVPDDQQRDRMARSVEDITATLDDILSLSRVGRDGTGAEAVDLGALTISVAEEFEDLGEAVSIIDPPRVVADVQVTWIKRALRNLVSNALRYGETAEVSLHQDDARIILRVDDRGPGIPEDRIAAMLEPFTRGEASRNRATGGAGLGLTLARAIAEQHGGELVLTNRSEGGLRAELRLPH